MALQQEIWSQDIQENLFAANPFMNRATDHSQWVNFKTVHVPQAGSNPVVTKNRSVLPAAITQRTDTELTYSLNEYTSEPILITNIEELQISYNKRASVLATTIKQLSDCVANNSLYSWAPSGAGRIVRTTGVADALALAPSATGTRKAITLADVAKLRSMLDNDNVPMDGRILLLPADMYNGQLLAINNIQSALAYGTPVMPTGVVQKLFGFDIMIRPTVLVYDNTGTPVIKAVDDQGNPSVPATTDNLAAIAYHPQFVAHALGSITAFADENKPEYYGSIFSSLVMHGASKLRTSQLGIVALVQTT